MFERETTLNRFLMDAFQKIAADVPADRISEPAPGHGHPPIWILGHLALCAELGEMLLGGELSHPQWMPVFGPGSSDVVENADQYSKDELVDEIVCGYRQLIELADSADPEHLKQPHGIELLEGTPIATVGDVVSHLLGTHFSFHLAQLSAWRRAAGFGPIL